MKRHTQPKHSAPSDSEDYLETDDEVNEFEDGMQIESDEEGEEQGIAQWEPDSWDIGADEDDDDEDEDIVQGRRCPLRLACPCLIIPDLSSVPLSTLAKARSKMNKVSKYQKGESSKSAVASTVSRNKQDKVRARIESRESKHA
jgi:hypothetical protein